MTRSEIIAALERAECGDRELDAEIDIVLFGGETIWKTANYTMEQYPASRRPSTAHVGGYANEHVPHYTASLDATVALVERVLPNVTLWDATWRNMADLCARPRWRGFAGINGRCQESASTPALALLLALFRALEDTKP